MYVSVVHTRKVGMFSIAILQTEASRPLSITPNRCTSSLPMRNGTSAPGPSQKKIHREILSLPMSLVMTAEEIRFVTDTVNA